MSKQKFEVIRAWAGVELGDVIDLDPAKIHPAIKANIRPVTKAKAKGDDGAAVAAEKLIADAKAEAEQIVKDARTAADTILTEAYAEAEKAKAKAK